MDLPDTLDMVVTCVKKFLGAFEANFLTQKMQFGQTMFVTPQPAFETPFSKIGFLLVFPKVHRTSLFTSVKKSGSYDAII